MLRAVGWWIRALLLVGALACSTAAYLMARQEQTRATPAPVRPSIGAAAWPQPVGAAEASDVEGEGST
jgi:hypothetical protein